VGSIQRAARSASSYYTHCSIPTAHRSNNIDNVIDSYINPEQSNATSELDEYQEWKLREPIAVKDGHDANNPVEYWVALRHQYPNLSKLAIDVLSIPASSCNCERMFSELGNLLEPRRRKLGPQLLAAMQCVRRWQRAGFGDNELCIGDNTNSAIIARSDGDPDDVYQLPDWEINT
jgi:hypothetical protein